MTMACRDAAATPVEVTAAIGDMNDARVARTDRERQAA